MTDKQEKYWIVAGSIIMLLAVVLGAFAAHALKAQLSPAYMAVFKTANQYHFIHGLAIFICMLIPKLNYKLRNAALIAFSSGIVLFSGSLYILAISGMKKLGMVTPFGGLAFIIGWALLALAAIKAE
ncbi:MAG: DUF423 domain-containing protein [Lentisphaeria bacterium]|nr:DUF423 domain-containing protein [Lentisphaeria bacterium]NQZ68549.1 DUF423 domain-containing protein [Lentisphaeria bacterium]